MLNYAVYQIHFDESIREQINRLGWSESQKHIPIVAAHLKYYQDYYGELNWKRSDFKHYKFCGNVKANDPEDAFHRLNIGEERASFKGHSLSIGDILVDIESGKGLMVRPYGFDEVQL